MKRFSCELCKRGRFHCTCEESPKTMPSPRDAAFLAEYKVARWAQPKPAPVVVLKPVPAPEVGIKHDSKKPQLSKYLHPLFANRHFLPIVLETIEVLKYGAAKYQPDNWTKVTPKERYLDAALRHLSAVDNGKWLDDEPDPEGNPGSGLPHVGHAACSVLMYGALALAERAKKP